MALPQRLGKALALKDREREVRALRVSTPEAHDETEGLREKEAQGVELLLTAPLWEPELQREGQLEVLTEREGAPVRELAPRRCWRKKCAKRWGCHCRCGSWARYWNQRSRASPCDFLVHFLMRRGSA